MSYTKGKLEYSGNNEVVGLQIRETGERIAFIKPANYANACRICQCVNSHDTLLEACKVAVKLYETDKSVGIGAKQFASKVINWDGFWETIKNLIAQAEKDGSQV